MMFESLKTLLRMGVLAALGLVGLSACSDVAALAGPTHEYLIKHDLKKAVDPPAEGEEQSAELDESIMVIRERLLSMDVIAHSVERVGDDRIALKASGENMREKLDVALGRTPKLTIQLVDDTALPEDARAGIAPPGSEVLPIADGSGSLAVRRVGGMSNRHINDASAGIDEQIGEPVIYIKFSEKGARKFARLSSENVGKPLAIVLEGEVISWPIIREPILGGSVQISGGFTIGEAEQLAMMLRSGALPGGFEVIAERELD